MNVRKDGANPWGVHVTCHMQDFIADTDTMSLFDDGPKELGLAPNDAEIGQRQVGF